MTHPVKIGINHPLCKTLQDKGYSIRLSKEIVCTIFDGIKEALLKKEDVYLPIGNFKVVKETRKKQRRIGLNGPEYVYKNSYNIKFEEVKNE
jgi:nucleoid DNA-binding protein